jgi:putative transposase
MARKRYPTALTAAQWRALKPLVPAAKPGGRPREVDMREVLNGIFYQTRGGASWRMLPHDLPPWGTVHYYYRRWRLDGAWQRMHDALREKVRRKAGRKASPSAALLDSQSVKTTKKGGRAATTRGRK